MAETGTKLTAAQKIEKARQSLEDVNRGTFNPDVFTADARLHGDLAGELRGPQAIVAGLKKAREGFDEFHQEPHAILADDEHTVALVNLKARRGGQEINARQVLVIHGDGQGRISEMWAMLDAETLKKLNR